MDGYTVKVLAEMAGVSVRTLRYYDEIGLLRPAIRSDSGYRLYGEKELFRLQQILFYRELDFSLEEILELLDDPDFDIPEALKNHRSDIQKEIDRLQRLQKTIDITLQRIEGVNTMLTDKELYDGFPGERYSKEAGQLYGESVVEKTENRIRKLSKNEWDGVKREGELIAEELSKITDREPADPSVQDIIKRHHAWIENFYSAPKELYSGLGLLYTQHPEFRNYYDKYSPGLADFLHKGIEYFCAHSL